MPRDAGSTASKGRTPVTRALRPGARAVGASRPRLPGRVASYARSGMGWNRALDAVSEAAGRAMSLP
jgi:hypothetical protein